EERERSISMISTLPDLRVTRGMTISSAFTCSSLRESISRVELTVASIPRVEKSASFLGSLTRAMVRGHLKTDLATWQITRLSSSVPVTDTRTSARLAPPSLRTLTREPFPSIKDSPNSVANRAALGLSFSIRRTSCPSARRSFARLYPTFPPPTTMIYMLEPFLYGLEHFLKRKIGGADRLQP